MRTKIAGDENYAPEVFARAEQLVWHYGLLSSSSFDLRKRQELQTRWLLEYPDIEPESQVSKTRVLVLAGRSLFYNAHVCDETCADLPVSSFH